MKKVLVAIAFCLLLAAIAVCQGNDKAKDQARTDTSRVKKPAKEITMDTLKISSPAFAPGEIIPRKFTCDGDNLSPLLHFSGIPPKTESLALICDDPDAPRGTWVHWVVFNLPPNTAELPEGVKIGTEKSLAGATEGVNDFGKTRYGGPCPPPGPAHRYFFKIYALDCRINLDRRATKTDVEKAMQGHILAAGELMGKYKRQK